MVIEAALAFTNHVLRNEVWATDRLRAFAGQAACIEVASWRCAVRIGNDGLLATCSADQPAAVTVRLPDDSALRLFGGRAALFATATISGSVELAETLALVFRNVRWDAEHDLAQLFGDIVGRRLWQATTKAWDWQARGAANVAQAVAEYWTEEAAVLASRRDIDHFCAAVDALRDDLARLEKKIEKIEKSEKSEQRSRELPQCRAESC